jgi:hypothetical protein
LEQKICSLFVESAIIGTLLSILFPFFVLSVRGERDSDWSNWKAILFSIAVGCPVSILYAAIFRKSLLGERSASAGPLTDDHSLLL